MTVGIVGVENPQIFPKLLFRFVEHAASKVRFHQPLPCPEIVGVQLIEDKLENGGRLAELFVPHQRLSVEQSGTDIFPIQIPGLLARGDHFLAADNVRALVENALFVAGKLLGNERSRDVILGQVHEIFHRLDALTGPVVANGQLHQHADGVRIVRFKLQHPPTIDLRLGQRANQHQHIGPGQEKAGLVRNHLVDVVPMHQTLLIFFIRIQGPRQIDLHVNTLGVLLKQCPEDRDRFIAFAAPEQHPPVVETNFELRGVDAQAVFIQLFGFYKIGIARGDLREKIVAQRFVGSDAHQSGPQVFRLFAAVGEPIGPPEGFPGPQQRGVFGNDRLQFGDCAFVFAVLHLHHGFIHLGPGRAYVHHIVLGDDTGQPQHKQAKQQNTETTAVGTEHVFLSGSRDVSSFRQPCGQHPHDSGECRRHPGPARACRSGQSHRAKRFPLCG